MVQISPDGSKFVEVGSWKGRSAAHMGVEIMNSGKRIQFDCVDTWRGSAEHLDPDSQWYTPELSDPEYLMNEFLKNTAPVSSVVKAVRSTSEEASRLYADNTLAFVFLDAAHDFDSVSSDIRCWYPKVKPGGVLAGDDFDWPGVEQGIGRALETGLLDPDQLVVGDSNLWVYQK